MSLVDWYVEGVEFGSCNCDYGCPCQFESRPTQGHCRGFEVVRIDKGRFGDVSLDGLCAALLYAWPGPVFEGNGEMQAIIDQRADAAQRQALTTILHGGETRDAATHWWVYHAMSSTVREPIFKPIEFEVDLEKRQARVSIPGVLESSGRPIRSPATGDSHIYSNHLEQVRTQLARAPRALPRLDILRRPPSIYDYRFEDFALVDYQPHPHIAAPVAV